LPVDCTFLKWVVCVCVCVCVCVSTLALYVFRIGTLQGDVGGGMMRMVVRHMCCGVGGLVPSIRGGGHIHHKVPAGRCSIHRHPILCLALDHHPCLHTLPHIAPQTPFPPSFPSSCILFNLRTEPAFGCLYDLVFAAAVGKILLKNKVHHLEVAVMRGFIGWRDGTEWRVLLSSIAAGPP